MDKPRNTKASPVLIAAVGTGLTLTPEEIEAGFMIVELPLTPQEIYSLRAVLRRTSFGLGYVVRDACRVEDIVSEIEHIEQGDLFVYKPTTGDRVPAVFTLKRQ